MVAHSGSVIPIPLFAVIEVIISLNWPGLYVFCILVFVVVYIVV